MPHAFERLAAFFRKHVLEEAAILAVWGLCLVLSGCATGGHASLHGETPMLASWYGKEQQHGPTASGCRFDMYGYTAAHRTLPLGTILIVLNPKNDKSVRVTITDRGPYVHGRDLDLSYAAARDLDIIKTGVARVYVRQVGHDSKYDHYWKKGVPPSVADEAPASPGHG
jgi:rare lipoprotein A (peptidoglycan hydrolase)